MSPDRSEENSAEGAPEGQEPVVQASAHPTRGAPKQIGDHHPHLFSEERCPNQAVRPQIRLECGLRKERRAGSSDEIRSDPGEPFRTSRPKRGLHPTSPQEVWRPRVADGLGRALSESWSSGL